MSLVAAPRHASDVCELSVIVNPNCGVIRYVCGLPFPSLESGIAVVAVIVFRTQKWQYLDKRSRLGRIQIVYH